jgi:hypothetical protein
MFRVSIACLGLGVALACETLVASAYAPTPKPSPSSSPAAFNAHPKNIEGSVSAIDYRTGEMTVQTASGKVDVTVLPSTTIQECKPHFASPSDCSTGFYAISDISKGALVHVTMSQQGDQNRAQVISILK